MIHFRKIPQIDYYDTPGRPAYQRHNLETLPFCFERTTFFKKADGGYARKVRSIIRSHPLEGSSANTTLDSIIAERDFQG